MSPRTALKSIALAVVCGSTLISLAACSGQDAAPAAGATGSPTSATGAAAPKESPKASASPSARPSPDIDPTPVKCGVSQKDVKLLVRNWGRVTGAVGRNDQATYTAPFVKQIDQLALKGKDCPAPAKIATLAVLAHKIDRDARAGRPSYSTIRSFTNTGDAWLVALGYNDSTASLDG